MTEKPILLFIAVILALFTLGAIFRVIHAPAWAALLSFALCILFVRESGRGG